jgi:hypothetical protein
MELFTDHIGTWLTTSIIALITIFSDKIIERIRLAINKADLRIKYYEELAIDLSSYIFWSEVYLERFENEWTEDIDDLEKIAGELNTAMTTLRKKEFVYKSWVNKYWKRKQKGKFADIFISIKNLDLASHAFNAAGDELEKAKKYRSELELLQNKVNFWLSESAA